MIVPRVAVRPWVNLWLRCLNSSSQQIVFSSALKDPSQSGSAIVDAIEIIDIAGWCKILLLYLSCVPESVFDCLL